MRILWRPAADSDLDAIIDYIERDDALAAIALGDIITRRVAELGDQPGLYRSGRVRGTREMVVHRNYVVVYRIKRDVIEIVRVLHAPRQYPPRQ